MKKEGNGRKPGRPPRLRGEKLVRVQLNLAPKLKFGLELLARSQHRSLSQTVEWALQRELSSYALPGEKEGALGDLVDTLWDFSSEAMRAIVLHRLAPSLLGFEENAACTMVRDSRELAEIEDRAQYLEQAAELLKGTSQEHSPDASPKLWRMRMNASFNQMVEENWPKIVRIAAARADQGKSLSGLSLLELLDIKSLDPQPVGALETAPSRRPKDRKK